MLFATAVFGLFAMAAPALASSQGSVDIEARAIPAGNLGAKCKYNSECKQVPTGARNSCNRNGVCDFVCLNAPILVKNRAGTGCVPNPNLTKVCDVDSDCSGKVRALPRYAEEQCLYGQCTYQCGDGYHKIAGKCFKNQNTCGGVRCASIENGDTFCGSDNKCVYRCQQAQGFTLYTNAARDAYRCINTGADVRNCGAAGNSCAAPYNGIGSRVCLSGTCSVDCTGNGRRLYNSNRGVYYCTGADSA